MARFKMILFQTIGNRSRDFGSNDNQNREFRGQFALFVKSMSSMQFECTNRIKH